MTKASTVPGSMTSKTIHEAFACNEYCEYERITDYFEYGILRVVLHSDSNYTKQSSCKVEMWTAHGWVHVFTPHPMVHKDVWAKASIHNRDSGMLMSKLANQLLATALEIIKTTAPKAKE